MEGADPAEAPFQKSVDAGKNSGEEDDGGFFPEGAAAANSGLPCKPKQNGACGEGVVEMAGFADGEGDVGVMFEPGGDAAGVGKGGKGDVEEERRDEGCSECGDGDPGSICAVLDGQVVINGHDLSMIEGAFTKSREGFTGEGGATLYRSESRRTPTPALPRSTRGGGKMGRAAVNGSYTCARAR